MFRFHPLFWLAVALFFLFRSQRRSMRRRWAMSGPMSYGPWGWGSWGGARDPEWARQSQIPAAPQPLAQPDRTLVESLESRIAELETRLEFTERLMANRKD
ncbi:MAG: hypothetical protein ABI889_00640 [Gemmatimonadota bacterium]